MPSLTHKLADGTDKVLEVGSKPLIIGRLAESEIQVRDTFISRVHAGIAHSGQHFTLKDFGSTNGTYRNGARIFECPLASGDRIQVGNATLIFEVDAVSGNATLRHAPPMVTPARAVSSAPPPPPAAKQVTMPINVIGSQRPGAGA
jgi:pSer/pThr/pTyr-binding forkhead associated (FHA) protein